MRRNSTRFAAVTSFVRGSCLPTHRHLSVLLAAPKYYERHRRTPDPFYRDRVILSPAAPVFRDDTGNLLDNPYTVGFLAARPPGAT